MKRVISLTVLYLCIIVGSFNTAVFAQESNRVIHWSEEKDSVYSPLLSFTLPWYDEVLKHGGFDIETESIVTAKDKADFVLNAYSDIGARRIATSDTFGKPLDKKSIIFPTDGLGYPLTSMKIAEGNTYLIEASDGKFVQIRINRISLPTKVEFSYVIEEDVPKEDMSEFTPRDPKYISDDQKVWTLQFNQMMDASTINNHTIYIKDSKGYLLKTTITLGPDKKRIYIYPEERYERDEEYNIYITKDVRSLEGKSMGTGIVMPFELDLNSSYPDMTEPKQIIGLNLINSQGKVKLSWYSSSANDLAGYLVYYRVKGDMKFTKLLKNNGDELYYTREIELTGIEDFKGKTVEFYVTAVDKSGNESIPSELMSTTFGSGGSGGNNTNLAAPTGLTAKALNGRIELDWYDQYELELLGYYLYISDNPTSNFEKVTFDSGDSVILESDIEVEGLENGTTYYFYLTAVDKNGNESVPSIAVSATPTVSFVQTWSGKWNSNYGVIQFTQSGPTVEGTFSYGISSGVISGTVEGNTLSGKYYENEWSYGDFIFTMSNDGKSFEGKYKLDGGINWARWNGTRLPN